MLATTLTRSDAADRAAVSGPSAPAPAEPARRARPGDDAAPARGLMVAVLASLPIWGLAVLLAHLAGVSF
jgi:hypothetical protein